MPENGSFKIRNDLEVSSYIIFFSLLNVSRLKADTYIGHSDSMLTDKASNFKPHCRNEAIALSSECLIFFSYHRNSNPQCISCVTGEIHSLKLGIRSERMDS